MFKKVIITFLILVINIFLSYNIFCEDSDRLISNYKISSETSDNEKEAAAMSDLVTLQAAMTLCHEETGWYVSLENLDDTLNPLAGFDYIDDGGGTAVIDDNTGMFRPDLFDFTSSPNIWPGPYVIYQPSRIADSTSDYDEGSPLDPWNMEYLFYSPLGLIEPKSRSISLRYGGIMFDRYAILSRGTDRIISGDDLVVTFGIPPQDLVISFINPNYGFPGEEVEILGYNFGDEQLSSQVLFNGVDAGTAILWTNTEITINVPSGSIFGPVTVIVGSETSNSLQFLVLTSVDQNLWSMYE